MNSKWWLVLVLAGTAFAQNAKVIALEPADSAL